MDIFMIDAPKLRRLEMISSMVAAYHCILDDLASECCGVLGVPDDHSDEGDLVRSIVDDSANVHDVIAKLTLMKADLQSIAVTVDS